ncbi:hypothetical protein JE024_38795 (plasmid) [Streptomyces zhihengii]|uniref:Uncharacterized protein n=2 Tax=Streptomyces zhihengii TaxID=1818004 RepID=A0ABS2V3T7_9ACTN|nr:hypothetical protein [Streptomyces zhihengii]MBM9624502.1 hypothetical protein [Streptomyces zhihengii]
MVSSAFDVRTFRFDNMPFTDLTVRIAFRNSLTDTAAVWRSLSQGVDEVFNRPAHGLPDGSVLHVTVEQVVEADHAHLVVDIVDRSQRMDQASWWPDAYPVEYAHELGHQLGLRDEYRDHGGQGRADISGSLMGDLGAMAPHDLPFGGLRGRHLQLLAALISDHPGSTAQLAVHARSARNSGHLNIGYMTRSPDWGRARNGARPYLRRHEWLDPLTQPSYFSMRARPQLPVTGRWPNAPAASETLRGARSDHDHSDRDPSYARAEYLEHQQHVEGFLERLYGDSLDQQEYERKRRGLQTLLSMTQQDSVTSFDVHMQELARDALHLSAPPADDDYRRILDVVGQSDGQPRSAAALAAYFLSEEYGVLGELTAFVDANGLQVGRDWSGARTPAPDTASYTTSDPTMGAVKHAAPWSEPYVIMTAGPAGALVVKVGSRAVRIHHPAELAELIALDNGRTGIQDIVLAISHGKDQGFGQLIADRTGAVVWATDAQVSVEVDAQTGAEHLHLTGGQGRWSPHQSGLATIEDDALAHLRARPLMTTDYEVIGAPPEAELFGHPSSLTGREFLYRSEGSGDLPPLTVPTVERQEVRVDAHPPLHVSQDLSLATMRDAYGQQVFASHRAVEEANRNLELAGSRVRMKMGDVLLRLSDGSGRHRDLVRVTPQFLTRSGRSEEDICRDFAQMLAGGVSASHVIFRNPDGSAAVKGPINALGRTEVTGINHLAAAVSQVAEGRESIAVVNPEWAAGQVLQDNRLIGEGDGPAPGREYGSALSVAVDNPQREVLSDVARMIGVNEHAWAEVGETYLTQSINALDENGLPSISRNYAKPSEIEGSHFGYHFAMVVIASEDGNHQITLENFSRRAVVAAEVKSAVDVNLDRVSPDELRMLRVAINEELDRNAVDGFPDDVLKQLRQHARLVDGLITAAEARREIARHTPGTEQHEVATASAERAERAARSRMKEAADLPKSSELWHFRMFSRRPGESYHEKSADLLTSDWSPVANPLTSVILHGHRLPQVGIVFDADTQRIEAAEGRKLDYVVEQVVRVGLWNLRNGLPIPQIAVTGRGEGRRGSLGTVPRGSAQVRTAGVHSELLRRLEEKLSQFQKSLIEPQLTIADFLVIASIDRPSTFWQRRHHRRMASQGTVGSTASRTPPSSPLRHDGHSTSLSSAQDAVKVTAYFADRAEDPAVPPSPRSRKKSASWNLLLHSPRVLRRVSGPPALWGSGAISEEHAPGARYFSVSETPPATPGASRRFTVGLHASDTAPAPTQATEAGRPHSWHSSATGHAPSGGQTGQETVTVLRSWRRMSRQVADPVPTRSHYVESPEPATPLGEDHASRGDISRGPASDTGPGAALGFGPKPSSKTEDAAQPTPPGRERRVRFAEDVISAPVPRITRIRGVLQQLENVRSHARDALGRPEPEVPGGRLAGYPTLPTVSETSELTAPRALSADEQQDWVDFVVHRELSGLPGSAEQHQEFEQPIRDRAWQYLRDLHREVLFAARGDEDAPPRFVRDADVTIPVEHLEADRPAVLEYGATDPVISEGVVDAFDDGSTLARDITTTGGTEITLRRSADVAHAILGVLRPRDMQLVLHRGMPQQITHSHEETLRETLLDLLRRPPAILAGLASSSQDAAVVSPAATGKRNTLEASSALGDGAYIRYQGADGRDYLATVRARNIGSFTRYADKVKVFLDESRSFTESNSQSSKQAFNFTPNFGTTLTPGTGLSGIGAINVSGGFHQSTHVTTRGFSSQEKQTIGTKEGSATFVSDIVYDIDVQELGADGSLHPVAGRSRRFVVRNGFQWRVPDYLTKSKEGRLGLPRKIRIPDGTVRAKMVVVDDCVPPRDLIPWALGVANQHAGVTLGSPGVDEITRFFRRGTMADRFIKSMRGVVWSSDLLDKDRNVVGHFSYRVLSDPSLTATLERSVRGTRMNTSKNTSGSVARDKEVASSITASVMGGPILNYPGVRAQAGITGQASTSRSNDSSVKEQGQKDSGIRHKGLQGLYRLQPRVEVTFHPAWKSGGLDRPPHLEDTDPQALTTVLPMQAVLRVPEHEARQWGGWDTSPNRPPREEAPTARRVTARTQATELGAAQSPANPAASGPSLPRELSGSIAQLMPYHSVRFDARTTAGRILSPMHDDADATRQASRPLVDQMVDDLLAKLRAHPDTHRFVAPAPSAVRRLSDRAAYPASHAVRKMRQQLQAANRAGANLDRATGKRRPTVLKTTPARHPTMSREARTTQHNRNRLRTALTQLLQDTRMLSDAESSVVLVAQTPIHTHKLVLTLRSQPEPLQWTGHRPDLSLRGGQSGQTEISQSTQVTTGWRVTAGPEAGIKPMGPRSRLTAGIEASYGVNISRGSTTGMEATNVHQVTVEGVQAYEAPATITVTAAYTVRPRTVVRMTTGNKLRQQDKPIALGSAIGEAQVFHTWAQVLHPAALMPDRLRPLRRDQDDGPQPRPPEWLTEDQALAMDSARRRDPAYFDMVRHTHVRLEHAAPVAELIRKVLVAISPRETKWVFRTKGTDEDQAVVVLSEQVPSHLDALLGEGWIQHRWFIQGQVFRHEAVIRIDAVSQGLRATDVVDRGVSAERSVTSTLTAGSSTGKQHQKALQAQINVAAPDPTAAPVVAGASYQFYGRSTRDGDSQGLAVAHQVSEEQSGRLVRAVYDSTTYIAVGEEWSHRVGASKRKAAAGVVVFGQRDEALPWVDARRLGLVDNGFEEMREPALLRPLVGQPVFVSLVGAIDSGQAFRSFQQAMQQQAPGSFPTGPRDASGLSSMLHSLLTPVSLRASYDQLTAEGVTLRHGRTALLKDHSGVVRVRLLRGAPVYRSTRYGWTTAENRSATDKSQSTTDREHRQGLSVTGLTLPATGDDAVRAVASSLQAAISLPSGHGNSTTQETTLKQSLSTRGRHVEFDVPLDLELTYTRHDGKTVQVVSKDVGTFRELHPSSLLVDGTDDQPQDADRAPNVSETDPIESSAHQTTVAVETGPSHGVLREPVTVEEVSPGDAQRWLQDGDESTRNFLTHRDVSFLHVPDVERMQRHLIHVVDHADDANPGAAADTVKGLEKSPSIRSDGHVPRNSPHTKSRWGKLFRSPELKNSASRTTVTRQGSASFQQLTQQLSSRFMRATGAAQALGPDGYQPPPVPDSAMIGATTANPTIRYRPSPGAKPRLIGVVDDIAASSYRGVSESQQRQEFTRAIESVVNGSALPLLVVPDGNPATGNLLPGQRVPLNQVSEPTRTAGGIKDAFQVGPKPDPERMLLLEFQIDQRVEAHVTKNWARRLIDALSHPLRHLRRTSSDKSAARSQAFAASFPAEGRLVVLAPERVAREHGIIDDARYPAEVTTAFDHVKDLTKQLDEAETAYRAAVVPVERDHAEWYEILRDPDPQRRKDRFAAAAARFVEHEEERARRRDAHRHLVAEYGKAKASAQEQLEWHRDAHNDDDVAKPVAYQPAKAADLQRHVLADTDERSQHLLEVDEPAPYDDAELRRLAATAQSPGDLWPGGVPPRHTALLETMKAHALRLVAQAKQQEAHEALASSEHDLARLLRAEAAYYENAYARAVTARDAMNAAIERGLSTLGRTEADHLSQGHLVDVRPDEIEILRNELRIRVAEDSQHGVSASLPSVTAGQDREPLRISSILLPPRAAHTAAARRAARTKQLTHAAREAAQDRAAHIDRLRDRLKQALTQQAVADFARAQMPRPSALPTTALAQDRPEAERRALTNRDRNDRQEKFTSGQDTEDGPATYYTAPSGTIYDIRDPHDPERPETTRGEGLPLALHTAWYAQAHPDQAPPTDTAQEIAHRVRSALAEQLRQDGARNASWLLSTSDDDSTTWLQPEPGRDVFTQQDLQAAGLDHLEPGHRAEFDQDHTLHTNVPLGHAARIELLARQIERDATFTSGGPADREPAHHDHSAADYMPVLFARRYGVEVNIVRPDKPVLTFRPEDLGAPDMHRVHVLLDDDTFKALIPRTVPTAHSPSLAQHTEPTPEERSGEQQPRLNVAHQSMLQRARTRLGKLTPSRYDESQAWAKRQVTADRLATSTSGMPDSTAQTGSSALALELTDLVAHTYATQGTKAAAALSGELAAMYGMRSQQTSAGTVLVSDSEATPERASRWSAKPVRTMPLHNATGEQVGLSFLDQDEHDLVAARGWTGNLAARQVTHVLTQQEDIGHPVRYQLAAGLPTEDVPLPDDTYFVDAHGTASGLWADNGTLAADDVADVLQADGSYWQLPRNGAVVLLACKSGDTAQSLSNRLRRPVWAPTTRLDTVAGISSMTPSPLVLISEDGQRGELALYQPDPDEAELRSVAIAASIRTESDGPLTEAEQARLVGLVRTFTRLWPTADIRHQISDLASLHALDQLWLGLAPDTGQDSGRQPMNSNTLNDLVRETLRLPVDGVVQPADHRQLVTMITQQKPTGALNLTQLRITARLTGLRPSDPLIAGRGEPVLSVLPRGDEPALGGARPWYAPVDWHRGEGSESRALDAAERLGRELGFSSVRADLHLSFDALPPARQVARVVAWAFYTGASEDLVRSKVPGWVKQAAAQRVSWGRDKPSEARSPGSGRGLYWPTRPSLPTAEAGGTATATATQRPRAGSFSAQPAYGGLSHAARSLGPSAPDARPRTNSSGSLIAGRGEPVLSVLPRGDEPALGGARPWYAPVDWHRGEGSESRALDAAERLGRELGFSSVRADLHLSFDALPPARQVARVVAWAFYTGASEDLVRSKVPGWVKQAAAQRVSWGRDKPSEARSPGSGRGLYWPTRPSLPTAEAGGTATATATQRPRAGSFSAQPAYGGLSHAARPQSVGPGFGQGVPEVRPRAGSFSAQPAYGGLSHAARPQSVGPGFGQGVPEVRPRAGSFSAQPAYGGLSHAARPQSVGPGFGQGAPETRPQADAYFRHAGLSWPRHTTTGDGGLSSQRRAERNPSATDMHPSHRFFTGFQSVRSRRPAPSSPFGYIPPDPDLGIRSAPTVLRTTWSSPESADLFQVD